jgi:hypothetical protein
MLSRNYTLPVTPRKLYEKGVPIKKTKFDDLQSLLPYIPTVYHEFFNNLPREKNNNEDVECHPDILE